MTKPSTDIEIEVRKANRMAAIETGFQVGDKVYSPYSYRGVITARHITERQNGTILRRYTIEYSTLTRDRNEQVVDEEWLITAGAPMAAFFYLAAAWELPILKKMHDRAMTQGRKPFVEQFEIDKQEKEVNAAGAWLKAEGWIE